MSATKPKGKPGPVPIPAPEERETWITDRAGIAYLLGVKFATISKLNARGMPKLSRGRYHMADCAQWYFSDKGGLDPDENEEVIEARTELYRAQTESKRIDNLRETKELAYVSDLRAIVEQLHAETVAAIEPLPARCAKDYADANNEREARALLEQHANELRARLYERVNEIARDLAIHIEDSATAT